MGTKKQIEEPEILNKGKSNSGEKAEGREDE